MRLSVIIPTLNEAGYLGRTIEEIYSKATLGEPPEVIVVDTGSTDGTTQIASELGVRLFNFEGAPGRGQALNEGASHASGGALLFLDADTIPPEGYDEAIVEALRDSLVVGGAFEFALDGSRLIFRVVEAVNRAHYRLLKLYNGDQGIFVRASVFSQVGGYPPSRLLEGYQLSRVLKRKGKLALIKRKMTTSPRRFVEGGVLRVIAKDLYIWFLDFLGRPVDRFADAYWADNRERGNKAPKKT